MKLQRILLLLLLITMTACGAAARQVIPTERPTVTATLSATPSRTPGVNVTPTPVDATGTAGPTPTSIFGPTSTSVAVLSTSTRIPNPNAPRIEFFTSDVLAVAPGQSLTLFWSIRGTSTATIYRVDSEGVRGNLWNVPPDGNLVVSTSRRDRVQVSFLLTAGTGDLATEQLLTIPVSCPDPWFFQPSPESCPAGPAEATTLIEQPFERGRMVYIETRDRVYALFNDAIEPAWLSFENRYDPAIHPEFDENFERALPPGLVQPMRMLGFVWRGNDLTRNRLGLGLAAESAYEGFVQTVTSADGAENLYLSSVDGSVLQLLPQGASWQIITAP